ncbi:hypothetical protein ACFE04_011552 [Oxalis oulophora]
MKQELLALRDGVCNPDLRERALLELSKHACLRPPVLHMGALEMVWFNRMLTSDRRKFVLSDSSEEQSLPILRRTRRLELYNQSFLALFGVVQDEGEVMDK